MSAAKPLRTLAAVVRQVVPWLLMLGILGFLFSTLPLRNVLNTFERIAVEVYISAMTSIVVITLLTDAIGYVFALRRVVPEHGTSLQNRAASYLSSNLSYAPGLLGARCPAGVEQLGDNSKRQAVTGGDFLSGRVPRVTALGETDRQCRTGQIPSTRPVAFMTGRGPAGEDMGATSVFDAGCARL